MMEIDAGRVGMGHELGIICGRHFETQGIDTNDGSNLTKIWYRYWLDISLVWFHMTFGFYGRHRFEVQPLTVEGPYRYGWIKTTRKEAERIMVK